MLAVIWRTIKDRKYPVFVYSIGAIAFLEMYMALFPTLQKEAQDMAKMLDTMPEGMWKAFNIDKASLTFEKVGPYLAMEQFNFIWPVLAVIFAIGFAGYALANEIEKGTIEVLLAQPISRTKLFFARYLAGLLNIAAFCAFSILAIIPLATLQGVEVNNTGIFALTLISFLFVWAVYSITFAASAIFSEKSKVAFVGGGFLILMYVANILAGLEEKLSNLQYLSFFHYYNPANAIEEATFVEYSLYVYGGVILIASLIALFWFNKRDIAV
jgi:ABC-2 type transport system permease protein